MLRCGFWSGPSTALARRGVLAALAALAGLSACTSALPRLEAGVATRADVEAAMGAPAMSWALAGGGAQLAYTSGPAGYRTRMAVFGPDGRLVRIHDVLREETMDRVVAGMSEDEVLRLIGPPVPQWTADFSARDERVMEWRFCSQFSQISRFDVVLDRPTRTVRSTMSQVEQCGRDVCYCGH
jgi:hypothetical protein